MVLDEVGMTKVYYLSDALYDAAHTNQASASMSEYINSIGFTSCKFVDDIDPAYWEFSEVEYTWFILQWT